MKTILAFDHVNISCNNGIWSAVNEKTNETIAHGTSELDVHDACVKRGYRVFCVDTAGDKDFVKSMESTDMHD